MKQCMSKRKALTNDKQPLQNIKGAFDEKRIAV
jgi:hypothetical protein